MVATTLEITPELLDELRRRQAAGEPISRLAGQVGMKWQKLWGLLRQALPVPAGAPVEPPGPAAAAQPVLRAVPNVVSLVEKYRPLSLDAIWGQAKAVKLLRKFAGRPYPCAFLFEGETGTGKTSAALALASALGCDVAQGEFGGVTQIPSGEQSAEAVREMNNRLWNMPFYGSGWKVLVVNEADRMHLSAEMVWLDRLENLPKRAVVIFTTNSADRLQSRLKDRCVRVKFEYDAAKLTPAAMELAAAVWKAETGQEPSPERLAAILAETKRETSCLSFRRLLQVVSQALVDAEE